MTTHSDDLHRQAELLGALTRAERVTAAAATLPADLPAVDRGFLAHMIAGHGVDRESALERGAAAWRQLHRLMPHADHSHGWDPIPLPGQTEG